MGYFITEGRSEKTQAELHSMIWPEPDIEPEPRPLVDRLRSAGVEVHVSAKKNG